MSGSFVAGNLSRLYVVETPAYLISGSNLSLVTDSSGYPAGIAPDDPWSLPPLLVNTETMPLCMISFVDCEIRNVTDGCASACSPCLTAGSVSAVALTNTTAYTAPGTSLVRVSITGQTLDSNSIGPISITDGYSSLVTNGSLYQMPQTLTDDHVHSRCDGTVFFLRSDRKKREDRSRRSRDPQPMTVVIPSEASWNGRILEYKNIGDEPVVIEVIGHKIDGSRTIGRSVTLNPLDSITLRNRGGRYYIVSRYTAPYVCA